LTRKSKKGIVGKFPNANKRRGPVGPGIDFVEEHLGTGPEIERAVEKRMHDH
jgi:hypothetical protein